MSPGTAFLLPGQGAQHERMAAGLYPAEPVFAAAMDEVLELFAEPCLRHDWLTAVPRTPIDDVARAQPLLFAVDYALARLVLSWGVRPGALLGHSLGELVGAVLAGVFRLPDAVRLVRDRVRRARDAPAGGMLAVAAAPERVHPFLIGDVVVGAYNAPRQVVLAGPQPALGEVAAALRAAGLRCHPVPSGTPFHSPALAAANAGAEEMVAGLPVAPPRVPLYSGYTGEPLGTTATDPAYWAGHPVEPVRFWPALDRLLGDGARVVVETGPGQTLAQIARRHPAVRAGRARVVSLLPARPAGAEADRRAVAAARTALGQRSAIT
ncbi:acyltransferase domain-containing protein [Micromonospora aurantiaca]|uniref:acyltransferase domain-containing protein n=1 Tax=Micromonospora aurantiaca (nom. illeg.) TaxID=47850 RepID=UPI0037A66CF7